MITGRHRSSTELGTSSVGPEGRVGTPVQHDATVGVQPLVALVDRAVRGPVRQRAGVVRAQSAGERLARRLGCVAPLPGLLYDRVLGCELGPVRRRAPLPCRT